MFWCFFNSFKSKRYRDKLRTEIKALELLLPIDRTALSRKLDSQSVFRLVIAYFRSKICFRDFCEEIKGGTVQELTKGQDHVTNDRALQDLINEASITQLLDGFLLVITSDGTVLYVSDTILPYLGFNQVDLMHRCIYGVVHPDDHQQVKCVLENTLDHAQLQPSNSGTVEAGSDTRDLEGDACKPVSFLCRMKCFNGNSAGYLKVFFSGKITHLPEAFKSRRNSCQVLFLFGHPFMINTAEVDQQTKQNVFWSKHDLDLSVRELDKKAVCVLGYDSVDVEGRSLYSLIHPEDVNTVAVCHRTLINCSDVQTVYFRVESKHGHWIWVHSRGKVICKNSKKFSIVFSHCPIREEDSTYIQQESVLRNRYAIKDLMCQNSMNQNESYYKDQLIYYATKEPRMVCTPSQAIDQDDVLLGSPGSPPCPSSWHALSDRHSPILPSSHVAHKISQRERQVQFQEFKRRKETQPSNCILGPVKPYVVDQLHRPHFSVMNESPFYYQDDHAMQTRWCHRFWPKEEFSRWKPFQYFPTCAYAPVQPRNLHSVNNDCHVTHNMPPSPPPSPPIHQHDPNSRGHLPIETVNPNFGNYGGLGTVCMHTESPGYVTDICNTRKAYLNSDSYHQSLYSENSCHRTENEASEFRRHLANQMAGIKRFASASQSCAYATNDMQNGDSQQDAWTAGHMMIVEHGQAVVPRNFTDLPSIGSFLEYLNEV